MVGLCGKDLTERNNGARNLYQGSHKVVLKIMQTNLQVKGSNNVFSRIVGESQNHGVRFDKALHASNQLRKVSRVLWLNSTSNNRRHRDFLSTDGSGLQQQ